MTPCFLKIFLHEYGKMHVYLIKCIWFFSNTIFNKIPTELSCEAVYFWKIFTEQILVARPGTGSVKRGKINKMTNILWNMSLNL